MCILQICMDRLHYIDIYGTLVLDIVDVIFTFPYQTGIPGVVELKHPKNKKLSWRTKL